MYSSTLSASDRQFTIFRLPVAFLTDVPGFQGGILTIETFRRAVKSTLDIVGALTLLVVTLPALLVIALLIRLTSSGPVFYRQERIGINQRRFLMWKFRTMVVDAETLDNQFAAADGAIFFKVKDDPRITKVGRILRRYSLDELPQLINVLRGDMSLVGPRPIRECELRQFRHWRQLRRFNMKPGLTCIWQVSGRSDTSDDDRMSYDLEYVDSWSLRLDLGLLIRTIPVVFSGDGAY